MSHHFAAATENGVPSPLSLFTKVVDKNGSSGYSVLDHQTQNNGHMKDGWIMVHTKKNKRLIAKTSTMSHHFVTTTDNAAPSPLPVLTTVLSEIGSSGKSVSEHQEQDDRHVKNEWILVQTKKHKRGFKYPDVAC